MAQTGRRTLGNSGCFPWRGVSGLSVSLSQGLFWMRAPLLERLILGLQGDPQATMLSVSGLMIAVHRIEQRQGKGEVWNRSRLYCESSI